MRYLRMNLKAEVRRRRAAGITIGVFLVVFAALSGAAFFCMRPEISEAENRRLASFPELSPESYVSGEFARGLDEYFTDTVPFRDVLNGCASIIESAKGLPSPQFYGVEIVNDGDVMTAEAGEETTAAPPKETVIITDTPVPAGKAPELDLSFLFEDTGTSASDPEEEEEPEEEFAGDIKDFLNNGILVNGVDMYGEKAGVMLFGGNNKQGTRYAESISAYKEALGSNINVYNMIVPTSVEFYLPKKYKRYSNSEKDQIDFIYGQYTNGVIPVDAYSVLAGHKKEYIYFRTDHHWTALGAYYAYTAFCDAIGQTAPSLDEYTTKTKDEPYVGSLYGYTNDITLKNNPDSFTYYIPKTSFTGESFKYDTLRSSGANMIFHEYASGSSLYAMFLGSDSAHIKITTSAGTGRKIVVFKESYGNAFAPFLIDSFDEIYIIDIRYFGANAVDYIKKVGATDVLFINNVFAANTSMLIDKIELMRTSPTGTVTAAAKPAAQTTAPPKEKEPEETKKKKASEKKSGTEEQPAAVSHEDTDEIIIEE